MNTVIEPLSAYKGAVWFAAAAGKGNSSCSCNSCSLVLVCCNFTVKTAKMQHFAAANLIATFALARAEQKTEPNRKTEPNGSVYLVFFSF